MRVISSRDVRCKTACTNSQHHLRCAKIALAAVSWQPLHACGKKLKIIYEMNEQPYLLGVVKIANSFIYFHCKQRQQKAKSCKAYSAKWVYQKFLLHSSFYFQPFWFCFLFLPFPPQARLFATMLFILFHFISCCFCCVFRFFTSVSY